jgi:hypothetical protein
MIQVNVWLPPKSITIIPKICHFDAHNNVVTMEDNVLRVLQSGSCSALARPLLFPICQRPLAGDWEVSAHLFVNGAAETLVEYLMLTGASKPTSLRLGGRIFI